MFGKDRENLVSAKLEEKGATRPCSRCGNGEFEIIGEAVIPLVANQLYIWHPSLPADLPILLTACKNCGYTATHITAFLGLPEFHPRT